MISDRSVSPRWSVAIIMIALIMIFLAYQGYHKTVSIFLLVESAIVLFKSRTNLQSIIIFGFLLWFIYSYLMVNFLNPMEEFATGFKKDPASNVSLVILLIFNTALIVFSKKAHPFVPIDYKSKKRHSDILVYSTLLLLIYIFTTGFVRPDTLGERADPTPLYEYSVVFFILAFFYSRSKFQRIIISVFLILFAAQNLVFGGRITAMQLLLCLFLMNYTPKWKIGVILPVALILMALFNLIGAFRATLFAGGANGLSITDMTGNYFALDTSYYAFHTSITFIKTADVTALGTKLYMFGQFLKSIVFGGSSTPDSILAEYTIDFYEHCYGGVLPYFGFFYLGLFGVILFSVYLVSVYNKIITNQGNKYKDFLFCLGVFFTCTTPRWFLYSPSPVTRGLLIMTIVYIAYSVAYSFINGIKTTKPN